MSQLKFAASLLCFCLLVSVVWAKPAIDPDEGLEHYNWQDARAAVGDEAFIYGKIIEVGSAGRVNFLNFADERPAEFTVIIFGNNTDKFSGSLEDLYANKLVRVRGRVSLYRDHPQIIVNDPKQIEVIDRMPELSKPKPAAASTAVKHEGPLVVATYNVLNMFDDHDDPYHGDEGTRTKPREELELLSYSISELNADVIALQEVENRFYLEKFIDVFLADKGYEHVVHYEGNDGRGIDVCLISRVPIGPVRSYRHVSFPGPDDSVRRFNRDVIAVTVEPSGAKPLDVWVVHLKSNSGGREFAEPVRLAEARKLRELLDKELAGDPEASFVVVGDFNDTWESETLSTIVGEGSAALWSCSSEQQGGELPETYNQGEFRSMIDFILCSPAMSRKYVRGSFRVIPGGSPAMTGSDHNPVVASFELEP